MRHIFCLAFLTLLLVGYMQAAETPAVIEIRLGNSGGAQSARFSPDGTKIVTAAKDRTACIWDTETGQKLHTLQHADWVRTAAFSPDGKKVVTGRDDNIARIWDAESGGKLNKLEGHEDLLIIADFAPDGKNVVTVTAKGPDAQIVRIWDTESGKELRKLEGHTGSVRFTTFSSDSKKLATWAYDASVRIWDVETGKELLKLSANKVAFSPDGKKVVTNVLGINGHQPTAAIWDVETGQELQRLEGHAGIIYFVAFSPDGKKVATTSLDDTARIWDTESGRELQRLRGGPNDIRDTRGVIFGSAVVPTSIVQFSEVVFSPNGKYILTSGDSSGWDKIARIWDVETGKQVEVLDGHAGELILQASFSPDGKKVVTEAGGLTVRIWDWQRLPPPVRPVMRDF